MVVLPSVVDKTIEKEKLSHVVTTTKSYLPLPTHVATSAGNALGKTSYAQKSLDDNTVLESFPPLSTPVTTEAGNASGKSSYANVTGNRVAYPVVANYNNPFILKKWHLDENLLKEDVNTILVWVKLHGVHVMAFINDGLSVISTKLELKGRATILVIFVLSMGENPLGITNSAHKGTNNVSSSNTPIGEKIDKIERKIYEGKLRFVDDDGNPLVPTDGSDKGYGTNSLLEQWRDSYRDNDDYDTYDDDIRNSLEELFTQQEKMELETKQTSFTAKLPMLKQGDYEMWRLKIEQYFQVQDYALWDVIESGNSFMPITQTTTTKGGAITTTISSPVTAEEKIKKKNDVKAKKIRFGGNEATKKTQKTFLKQILPSEWNTHVLVWTNKPDVDTMSIDDLYNNFKIVEQESKNANEDIPNELKEYHDAPLVKDRVLDNKDCSVESPVVVEKKTNVPTIYKVEFVRPKQQEKPVRKPVKYAELYRAREINTARPRAVNTARPKAINTARLRAVNTARPNLAVANAVQEDRGYVDSRCSRHMIWNMSYLSDFKEFDGGYVTFGGGANGGQIISKGTFKTATINETTGIFKKFITEIENLVDKKVKNRALVVKPHNKTPYELFRGRTPALSFMRPCGCHVTILNTLDHLGKFDGKADEGYFIGYSMNSKAFRLYNIRTRRVEENLHIEFLENKPIVAGAGPEWLFDIDMLIKSMNYVTVITRTNSNDFAGTKDSIGAGQSNMETGSTQDYIFMPLWKDGSPLFDSSRKISGTAGKKQDEVSDKESGALNELNSAFENLNTEYPDDPKMHGLETIATSDDSEKEADFTNLESSIHVIPTPTTRTLKNHPLKQVIRSLNTPVQTMSKLKPTNKQGFISAVYEGKTHEELNTLRIEAIRLFLAYASFMGFMVYQMHVKSAFLYERIKEEVYVFQPLRFEDLDHPSKVYKVTLFKDADDADVDVHLYRSMIGSLMYLTSSRPDIMCVVCVCARFQVTPKVSHLHAIKRIFKYRKGHLKLGLWYPKDSLFELMANTDSDYAGASLDRKSTTRGSEYAAAASCCRQVLWIQNQMLDYGKEQIQVLVDKKKVIITETSVRSDLHLEDAEDKHVTTTSNDPQLSGEDRLKLTELMELCTHLQSRVLALETTKANQALKIGSLKRREDTSKQERMIKDLDVDEGVALVDETQGRNGQDMFDTSILDDEEVIAKKEDSTSDLVPTVGVMMDADYELAARLQEEEGGELTTEEKSRLFVELMDIRRRYFARLRVEKIRSKPPTKTQKRNQMCTYLKNMANYKHKLVKGSEKATEGSSKKARGTPLSSKSPTIVDYKIYIEGRKSFFKIIRADDNIWKYQQGSAKILNGKLFDSCGVYCVTTHNMVYYILIEKMYPFKRNILHQMWNDVRLQVDYEVERAYDLFRLIRRQISEGYVPK
nr:hypothetical protein [Tanacetum cinerariifolium]